MEERTFCVYMHTNKINGKKYIGQTCKKPSKRWGLNGEKYRTCPHFYNAIYKYGWENFEHEILFDGLTVDEANEKEKELIEFYKSADDRFGYNIRFGGKNAEMPESIKKKIGDANRGKRHSEQTREKISQALVGKFLGENHPNFGKHISEEQKQKLRDANIGKKHSEETKQKMSASRKGEKCYWYGKKQSEEHKKRLAEAKKGKYIGENNPFAKRVVQYDLDGNFIKEWGSIADAAREVGTYISKISNCCKGRRKETNGYIWKYKGE